MLPVSAFLVADGAKSTPPLKGHLHFFQNPSFTSTPPLDQIHCFEEFEEFCSDLRSAFVHSEQPTEFDEYFARVLIVAQGTFSTAGFRATAAKEIPRIKNEIVQKSASKIKAHYARRLMKAVIIASLAVIVGSVVLHFATSFADSISSSSQTGSVAPQADSVAPQTGSVASQPIKPSDATSSNSHSLSHFSIINTGIVLAASFWGLLFASMSRSYMPTFESLTTSESDLMEPWFRLVFYGIAVFGICLLFETELVTLSFGEKVSTSQISTNSVVAIMIGLFLGIAERALPKEVEAWAKKLSTTTS